MRPAERFFERHRTMLLAHESWMAKVRSATDGQRARWQTGSIAQQMQAIANDLDFHEMMEPQGLSVTEIDRCLADDAHAQAIFSGSAANSAEFAVPGTPSFVINAHWLPMSTAGKRYNRCSTRLPPSLFGGKTLCKSADAKSLAVCAPGRLRLATDFALIREDSG